MNTAVLNRVLGFGFLAMLFTGYFLMTRREPTTDKDLRFDESVVREPAKSTNLAADIKQMWKTVPTSDFPVSPVSAINAAGRVFETVQLTGKTTNEVFALLGHNKTSSDSGYNFPFFPVEKGTVVYRFDCGNFGWQFNLVMDSSGKVQKMERNWIH